MPVELHTDFPGGNGLLLSTAKDDGAELRFVAEPKNCPEPLWFHFQMTNVLRRSVRCILANPEQTLGGPDWSANRPVWRGDGGEWQRCEPAGAVQQPGGRTEWAWNLPGGHEVLELAHCYPYQPADLSETLSGLGGAFEGTFIGVTLKNRPLTRLASSLPGHARPAIVLTARNHAGETPGSWLLDGVLRAVGADRELSKRFAWIAYPFVNLDDVVEGSYGKDPCPHDCNRAWGPGSHQRPETGAIMADIRRLRSMGRIAFLADLHAPSHAEQTFYIPLKGWSADEEINPMAEAFADRLHAATPAHLRSPVAHRTPKPGSGNQRYPGWTTSRWARGDLGIDTVTVETSYQGNGEVYYTIDDYRTLGATLAHALANWVAEKT